MIIKEIKNIILTSQFQFISVVAIVICSISVYISMEDYKVRLNNYNTIVQHNEQEIKKVHVFSYLRPIVAKQPEVMSIFCKGGEGEMGAYVEISPFNVPVELKNEINYNSYLSTNFEFDFNNIIAILLSLLALLISFNLISDEHEKGTLKLMLSNFVPRWKIIGAKLLASHLTISMTLILTFLIGIIILLFSPFVSLTSADILRIILIFLMYEIYLFVFIAIGSFVSILTKRTSVSLILCLFIWLFNIVIIPNGAVFFVESTVSEKDYFTSQKKIEVLKKEAEERKNEWLSKNPIPPKEYRIGYINFNNSEKKYIIRGVHPRYIHWCENYFGFLNDLNIEYANKIYQYEKLNSNFEDKQRKLSDRISMLSLYHILNTVVENISRTSWNDYENYLRSAQNYRNALITYIKNKKGFSSRKWFTDDPPDSEPWVPEPENFDISNLDKDMRIKQKAYMATKLYNNLESRRLNLNDMLQFSEIPLRTDQSFGNVLLQFMLLIIYTGLLIFFIIIIFNNYNLIS